MPDRAPLQLPALAEAPEVPEAPPSVVDAASSLGLDLSQADWVRLRGYLALLMGASQLMSLTAVKDPAEAWERLILDALCFAPLLQALPAASTIADVGCGGGLPGVPLAIVFPALRFTEIDATAKKLGFIEHVCEQLQLQNVRTVQGRAEALASSTGNVQGSHRGRYDLVVARAVAGLPQLLELTAPLAKSPSTSKQQSSSRLALMKGEQAQTELANAKRAIDLLRLRLDGSQSTPTGTLLLFSKRAETPLGYPRANGLPKRKPL